MIKTFLVLCQYKQFQVKFEMILKQGVVYKYAGKVSKVMLVYVSKVRSLKFDCAFI